MKNRMDRVADALERIAANTLDQSARMNSMERSRDGWRMEAGRLAVKNQKLRLQLKSLKRRPIA